MKCQQMHIKSISSEDCESFFQWSSSSSSAQKSELNSQQQHSIHLNESGSFAWHFFTMKAQEIYIEQLHLNDDSRRIKRKKKKRRQR